MKKFAITLNNVNTEDFKTALVRPKDFPEIPKGSKVEYLGEMTNWYGEWSQIIGSSGYLYYVSKDCLEILNDN